MSFERFLIWSPDCIPPRVRLSGTIYAILKEGIIGNIHVMLYEIWSSGSEGEVSLKKKFTHDGRATDKGRSQGSGELNIEYRIFEVLLLHVLAWS